MSLVKTHKIALRPTPDQGSAFAQHAGYARFAYNYALDIWWENHRRFEGELHLGHKTAETKRLCRWLNDFDLRPIWNAHKAFVCRDKQTGANWARALSQNPAKYAVIAVSDAVKTAYNDGQSNSYPRFKSRRSRRAFRADNGPGTIRCEDRTIVLPRKMGGTVRMAERLRFSGSIREVTIVQDGGRWFACVAVKTADTPAPKRRTPIVGVDVGVRKLAVCSDGRAFAYPGALDRLDRKIDRLNAKIDKSRNEYGKNRPSKRRERLYARRRKLYAKRAFTLSDALHKATTALAVAVGVLKVEGLNAKGIQSKTGRAAVGAFLRTLEYKAEWYGAQLIKVDRFFASSKTCHACKRKKAELGGSEIFRCPYPDCGFVTDRDMNAALNLRDWQPDSRPELVGDSKRTPSETALAASAASISGEPTPTKNLRSDAAQLSFVAD